MASPLARWSHRALLVGLLLAAYLWAWTPARSAWIEHGATPILQAVSPEEGSVTPHPKTQTVRIAPAQGQTVTYRAPAGIKFLLPALFLLLLVPHRPRLGLFFVGHLALGGLTLSLYVIGLAGLPVALVGGNFVQQYVVDAYSLAVPVFVFAGFPTLRSTSAQSETSG